MRVLTVASQRSNVGKTTAVAALVQGLSLRGYRVLAIDLDPQGDLSQAFGVDADRDGLPTSQDLLDGRHPAEVIVPTRLGDIIPSSIDLSCADMRFLSLERESLLANALSSLDGSYDYAVIDTPPNLGILTVNALAASSGVLALVGVDSYRARAVELLLDSVKTVRRTFNPSLRLYGAAIGRFDARAEGADGRLSEVKTQVGKIVEPVFDTVVRQGTGFKETLKSGEASLATPEKMPRDYRDLVDELLKVMTEHNHA